MSVRLTWLCLVGVLLTAVNLFEALRDYRAIKRLGTNGNLRDVARHGIFIEVLRLGKITALGIGVYLAVKYSTARSWIMAFVAITMGITSFCDLVFRHRIMRRMRAEYLAQEAQQK